MTASYADIESSNVPSILAAASVEEVNPLYGAAAANYGDENANDIQPYGEVCYYINNSESYLEISNLE